MGADLLESFIIQIFVNSNLDATASAAIVTTIGSIMAVIVYFYEQQARVALTKWADKIGIWDKISDTRNAIYKKMTPFTYNLGGFFR